MSMTVSKIWYDPTSASFHGRVDVRRQNQVFRYPCIVEGPMTMKSADVRRLMRQQATDMSDTPPTVYSHR